MLALKRTLLAIILLGGACYIGYKGYVYFEVKSELDQAIAMARPFADVRYGAITSTVDGNIAIEKIHIVPRGTAEPIRIGAIEIHTPGPLFLLRGAKFQGRGQLPEKISAVLRGLELDLRSNWVDKLDELLIAQASTAGQSRMNCGELKHFGPKQYRLLDYDRLVSDITVGYALDARDPYIDIYVEWVAQEVGSVRIDLALLDSGIRSLAKLGANQTLLTSFTARYRDDSFTQRLQRYCAQALEISAAEYIAAEIEHSTEHFRRSWGITPGPGLREAYRRFLEEPGEIEITAGPMNPVDLATLALYKPEDIVSLLNLAVRVNQQPVDDLSFALADEVRDHAVGSELMAQLDDLRPSLKQTVIPAQTEKQGMPDSKPSPPKPRFHRVAKEELSRYLGRQVRVHTSDANLRDGELARVNEGKIIIERRLLGGKMAVQVALRNITKVEVWY